MCTDEDELRKCGVCQGVCLWLPVSCQFGSPCVLGLGNEYARTTEKLDLCESVRESWTWTWTWTYQKGNRKL